MTSNLQKRSASPIAVVGVSALFPGSVDETGFWRDILAGKDLITDVPENHWLVEDYYDADPKARDKTYSKRGAFIPAVDFDPLAWGVPPSIVPATDTTQLLALIVAKRVLDDATGGQFEHMDKDRVSVILGITSAQELLGSMVSRLQHPIWAKSLREMGLPENQVQDACARIASHYVEWQESTFPGVLGNVVAGRIANRLDLGGTNCVTDAACASSFSAISMGVNELRLGQSDMVIAGGADTMNDIFMYMCFSKTPALSKTGDCKPFSDQADGTLLGEGIGMVALKRLEDAERDGDRIYALLKGLGSSSDGRANSVYAPLPSGQAKALRRTYEQAGYSPSTVGLLEAHGTGTVAGDAAEFAGLNMVFDVSERTGYCALGSVKSQIGHTKAASGAAGLFKVVMALHHKVLPPTIKIEKPNPKLNLESSAFYLNTQARPWIQAAGTPRRASVSAFGFGGSNFHLTLEEYQGALTPARLDEIPDELLVVGGDTLDSLKEKCLRLKADAHLEGMLAYLAYRSQQDWDSGALYRLAIVATSGEELACKVEKALRLLDEGDAFSTPDGIEFAYGEKTGDLAFVFTGQGSQYLQMGSELAQFQVAARASWDRFSSHELGREEQLEDVVFPRHAFEEAARRRQDERLTDTRWAQPAIAATSLSQLSLLTKLGVKPDAVAGHSLGEVTALHAAGVLSERDLLLATCRRGDLMSVASETAGAMLSVTASLEEVQEQLATGTSDVVVANHNSPHQVVLSGSVGGIESVEAALKGSGMSTRRLNVGTAFHSPLVSSACAPFHHFLEGLELSAPALDVYSGTAAKLYPRDASTTREWLSAQIAKPIQFVALIEAMYARNIRTFVEVGPGAVLCNLVGRILEGRPHQAVALDRKGRHGVSTFQRGLARLAVAGIPMNLSRLWEDRRTPVDPHDRVKPKLVLSIDGTSYGKPYPPPEGAAVMIKAKTEQAMSNSQESSPVPASNGAVSQPVASAPNGVAVAPLGSSSSPVPTAPVSSAGFSVAGAPAGWVQVYQEMQRQTVEAHTAYQRAMAESHSQFLRTAEASFSSLSAMLGGGSMLSAPAPTYASPPVVPPTALSPEAGLAPPVAPVYATPAAPPVYAAPTYAAPAVPVYSAPVAPPVPAAPAPAVSSVAASPETHTSNGTEPAGGAESQDLGALLLATVAAKTGYPEEMLALEMDLEADLGVDSIKRVEILAAMSQQAPDLPHLEPSELGNLRTLGQIVEYLQKDRASDSEGTKASAPGDGDFEKKAEGGVRI